MSEPAELLVGDIGGTGTRLACFVDGLQEDDPVCYSNGEHASFSSVLEDYQARRQGRLPPRAALAVAGPVANNRVRMTNRDWLLDSKLLAREFGFAQVEIINDFAALAWATLHLPDADLVRIGGSVRLPDANRAVVGPGTGLGVSALVTGTSGWVAVSGEGGHVSMAACTPEEWRLVQECVEAYGHCSAERLLSGAGLARIYASLGGAVKTPEAVTDEALRGDETALRAVDLFSTLLGTVAADAALTYGAYGGVYIAGGILPAVSDLFAGSGFRRRFESKGRFSGLLAEVPVYLIKRPYPAFVGLLAFMASH